MYKAEITIPIAFEVASEYESGKEVGRIARQKVRDAFADGKVLSRIVHDIQLLIGVREDDLIETEPLGLWDNKKGNIGYGINYGDDEDV